MSVSLILPFVYIASEHELKRNRLKQDALKEFGLEAYDTEMMNEVSDSLLKQTQKMMLGNIAKSHSFKARKSIHSGLVWV
jgi:uncharacterized protein YaaN involved in tellurite resistance